MAPLTHDDVAGALAGLPLGRVEVVDRTGSTSSDLVAAATADAAGWPDRSVLVADHQEAGRGRAGRTWTTPPGVALTVSVLLRPGVPLVRWGWVPLLAGLAVVRAVADVGGRAVLKWPNDVLVPAETELPGWGAHRKVAGVLGDLVGVGAHPVASAPGTPFGADAAHSAAAAHAVVVGAGVNVSQDADQLPVPSATSLALATGGAVDRVAVLAAYLRHLLDLDDRWRAADGDAAAAGVADEVAAACATLGSAVQVDRPGAGTLEGRATGLGDDGSLEVTDALGRVHAVLAGDVHHLRVAGPGS